MTKKLLATLALFAMVGCGTQVQAPLGAQQQAQEQELQGPEWTLQATSASRAEKWAKFMTDLNLTADQKTKAEAIKARFKPEQWAAKRTQFATLIGGDTVDKAAAETFFKGLVTDVDAVLAMKLTATKDFRALLTAEQRTMVAQMILDKMAKKHEHKGDHKGMHKGHKFMHAMLGVNVRRMLPAVAAFMLSGDDAKLESAFKSDKTADERVKAMSDAIMAMTKEDRQALIAKMNKHHEGEDATPDKPATAAP
ncbi:MAG: hypothetical protein JWM80_5899 [Cyanobacteria bacterium RYN_339]|nr:hypothetical protein [Cyanobacteria bacterium RYN_339]